MYQSKVAYCPCLHLQSLGASRTGWPLFKAVASKRDGSSPFRPAPYSAFLTVRSLWLFRARGCGILLASVAHSAFTPLSFAGLTL